ncbi:MAG: hypothetical protein QMD22_11460 [archaeon]|nr:hypothetical protein [archaeon]
MKEGMGFIIKLFPKVCGIKWWDGEKDITMDGINLHGIGKRNNLYVDGRRSIKEAII